jgi:hypothetical protein
LLQKGKIAQEMHSKNAGNGVKSGFGGLDVAPQ